MAALHVVHVDLELRPRVDLRERREQQVADRLARIGAARGRVHDDPAVQRAAAAVGGDAAVILDSFRGGAVVLDLRQQVDLAFAVGQEQAVERGTRRRFALERDAQVRAQEPAAEREQVLVVAAARGEPRDPGLDLGGSRRLLVQAQVRQGRAFCKHDFGREIAEHGRVPRGHELLDQHEPRARARLDHDARMLDRGHGRGRDVDEVKRLGDFAFIGDADQDAAGGEGVGEEREAVVGVVARRAQELERRRRISLEQGAEVRDVEPRSGEAVGQRSVETPVDEHDAARARDRQQARVGQGCGAAAPRGPTRRGTAAMRAWSRYFQFSSRRSGSPRARSVPSARSRRRAQADPPGSPGAGGGDALDERLSRSCRGGPLAQPVIAATLEFERKLAAAALDDPAARQHVHLVRHHVVEQPLVVRHEHDRALGRAQCVDAVGDHLERVDVEPGVGLVEQGERRLEQAHLQDLVALFLAAGKALVDAAVQQALVHAHRRELRLDQAEELEGVELGQAAVPGAARSARPSAGRRC